ILTPCPNLKAFRARLFRLFSVIHQEYEFSFVMIEHTTRYSWFNKSIHATSIMFSTCLYTHVKVVLYYIALS
ncbi:hypothetical protein L9F63_002425, partial [Diploptera punctata]